MLSFAVPHVPDAPILIPSGPDNNSSSSLHYPHPDINSLNHPAMDSVYLSDSPSPTSTSVAHLPQNSREHSQDRLFYPPEVSLPHHHSSNKYSSIPSPCTHRRMSDPTSFSALPVYSPVNDPRSSCTYYSQNNSAFAYPPLRPPTLYSTHIHRGASTGSLRNLRHHHSDFSPHSEQPEWKHEDTHISDPRQNVFGNRGDGFDEPISPHQPNFSGSSPTSAMHYSPLSDNPYGPSPPGTGTSTSSSVPPLSAGSGVPCSPTVSITQHLQRSISTPNISSDGAAIDRKTYSFVALPGNAVKKRPRRRYDEIERLYLCSWPDCKKAYGTLNHLNAHVTMQKHGPKRTPEEFKEMRKQWRKSKKEHVASSLLRRDSYGDSFDDPANYGHHYGTQHPLSRSQAFHDGLGLPSSVIGVEERYDVPIDDIRYPRSNEREESASLEANYEPMMPRQRYSNGLPASWHGSSTFSRSHLAHQHHQDQQQQEDYGPSVPNLAPQQHAHHSQLPQLSIGASQTRLSSLPPHSASVHSQDHHHHHHHYHPPPSMSVNRLTHNGPLLTTPLSGYHHHHPSASLLPPLQNGGGAPNVLYASDSYEVYDSDSTGRPGTGHTNVSMS